MRARRIIFTCLAAAMLSGMANATLSSAPGPFDMGSMGLAAFGFPASLAGDTSYGLPVTAGIYSPESAATLSSSLLSSLSGPGRLMAYSPGFSPAELSALTGIGGAGGATMDPSALLSSVPSGIYGMPSMQSLGTIPAIAGEAPSNGNIYTESSSGKAIKVKLGDTVRVQLKADVGQGYIWNMSVTHGLNISSEQAAPPDGMNLLSGTGITGPFTQDWSIKAMEPGPQAITAIYKRPQSDGPADRTFTLTVTVEQP